MKVAASASADSKTKFKHENEVNGNASGSDEDEDSHDSPKRHRSRSKSPRNVNYTNNGELMFDAAMYAPERPKRNRNKKPEENFPPLDDTLKANMSQKRKTDKPSGQNKKRTSDVKSTENSAGKRSKRPQRDEQEDGGPKPKKRCTKKPNDDVGKNMETKASAKGKADKSDKAEKSGKSGKSEKTDKSDKSEKVDKNEKVDKSGKNDKPDKSLKPDKSDKSDKLMKPDKGETPEKGDPSEKLDKLLKSEKANKSDEVENTDHIANSDLSHEDLDLSKPDEPDIAEKSDEAEGNKLAKAETSDMAEKAEKPVENVTLKGEECMKNGKANKSDSEKAVVDEKNKKDDKPGKNGKAEKSIDKPKRKYVRKVVVKKDESGSKSQKIINKKRGQKTNSETASKPPKDSESDSSDTEVLAKKKKTNNTKAKKPQSKSALVTPNKTESKPHGKTTPKSGKNKKSPAKIEIDGIEITELSDLNSSREDDFNSSRESLNHSANKSHDTSAETVAYDASSEAKLSPLKSPANGLASPCEQPYAQFLSSPKKYGADKLPSQEQWSLGSYVASPPQSHSTPSTDEAKRLPCQQPGCKYVGKSGVLLRKHMRNHGIFECAHCKFVEHAFERLEMHMKEKHPTRWGRKKCKKCSRHIRTDLHEEHERDCDGTKVWKCEHCSLEFPFESTLKEHKKKHAKAKVFQCDKCDYKCEAKSGLKSHVECVHGGDRPREHVCSECQRAFYTPQHLAQHRQCHAGGEHPCPQCAKTFKTESSLSNHMYVHQESANCACEVDGCGLKFKTPRLLNYHRKEVHKIGAPKMFKCEYDGCSAEFPRKSHLKKHVAVHTGERRFRCDWSGCNKTFRHNANLKIHYMQHTGEKPIACEHCAFACRQRSSILFHMKTKHPGLPIPRSERGKSPRREGSTTPKAARLDTSTEDTQDYVLSPPRTTSSPRGGDTATPKPRPLRLTGSLSRKPSVETAPSAAVYDFTDDDDDAAPATPAARPTPAHTPAGLKKVKSPAPARGPNSHTAPARAEDTALTVPAPAAQVASSAGDVSQPDGDDNDDNDNSPTEAAQNSADSTADSKKATPPPEVVSAAESAPRSDDAAESQSSSKFSDPVPEHVSENFAMSDEAEGTPTPQPAAPVEGTPTPPQPTPQQPATEQPTPVEQEPQEPPQEEAAEEELSAVNPIEGALDTTDDLDTHIAADDDVIDDKMLGSPMSTISEDMRALNMPNVTTDSTDHLIAAAAADLDMTPKKHTDHDDVPHKLDDMPPEIDANEVDALLESGLLDGSAGPDHDKKDAEPGHLPEHLPPEHLPEHLPGPEDEEPDVPSDYNEVMAKQPASNLSAPGTSAPHTPSYYGFPPSCGEPPPPANQLTPDRERASFESAFQQLSADRSPSFPGGGYQPSPHYSPPSTTAAPPGLYHAYHHHPAATTTATASLPAYNPAPSLPSYSPAPSLAAAYTSALPTYNPASALYSAAPPSAPAPLSFLDSAVSALSRSPLGRSPLDPLTSMARTAELTATTAAYTNSYPSAARDLFGHYFPPSAAAAPPAGSVDSLPLSHPPTAPPSGGGQVSRMPPLPPHTHMPPSAAGYSSSPSQSSFAALQRSSADLLQRATGGATYPGAGATVTEALAARLNSTPSAASWPGLPPPSDERRAWLPPDLSADPTATSARHPFSSTRPADYGFDPAAATKRPESAFPGTQTAAPPNAERWVNHANKHRYEMAASAYMHGAGAFTPAAAAAAAAAASNYARGLNSHLTPDYRSLSQPGGGGMTPADMYGRMAAMTPAASALSLADKYYPYGGRDPTAAAAAAAMYRSQHHTAAANPFMPQTSATHGYPGGGGGGGTPGVAGMFPPGAGPQDAAYGKYSGLPPERPPSEYFPRPTAAPDPYDPYRRSVIHNMMNRYF